jgi:type IV secretory pathway VirB6-like protein
MLNYLLLPVLVLIVAILLMQAAQTASRGLVEFDHARKLDAERQYIAVMLASP